MDAEARRTRPRLTDGRWTLVLLRIEVIALLTLLAVLPTGAVAGSTYVVQPDGLGDYPTIQAAITAATDGDIIELTDGTFTGDGNRDIAVPSRDLTIRSQGGDPMACIIDCEGSARAEHRGFYFDTTIGTGDATVQGIAVIYGYTTAHGGGILIEGASPLIDNCIVAECTADGSMARGGGVYVGDDGSPQFVDCIVTVCTGGYGAGVAIYQAEGTFESCTIGDNVATNRVGGVYLQSAGPSDFTDCSIVSNKAPRIGGIRTGSHLSGDITLTDCDISRNEATYDYAGGVCLVGGTVLTNCTIVDNSALGSGGGVYGRYDSGTLSNCIIAYSEDGCGVAAEEAGTEPTLNCCDVYGNVEGNYDAVVGDQTRVNDNFSLDPEFCDLAAADYRLYDTSPCLAGASPCGSLVGAFDQGCDSPVEETSWGALKAMFR